MSFRGKISDLQIRLLDLNNPPRTYPASQSLELCQFQYDFLRRSEGTVCSRTVAVSICLNNDKKLVEIGPLKKTLKAGQLKSFSTFRAIFD